MLCTQLYCCNSSSRSQDLYTKQMHCFLFQLYSFQGILHLSMHIQRMQSVLSFLVSVAVLSFPGCCTYRMQNYLYLSPCPVSGHSSHNWCNNRSPEYTTVSLSFHPQILLSSAPCCLPKDHYKNCYHTRLHFSVSLCC